MRRVVTDARFREKREPKRILTALLGELERARAERAPWYLWALEHRARRLGEVT